MQIDLIFWFEGVEQQFDDLASALWDGLNLKTV